MPGQKIDNEEKSIKFREKLVGALQRTSRDLRISYSKRETRGRKLEKKFQILLTIGALLLVMGALLNLTKNPLIWGTGTVTALFMILLFRIDPLSPND